MKTPGLFLIALLCPLAALAQSASIKVIDEYSDKVVTNGLGGFQLVTNSAVSFNISVPMSVDISRFNSATPVSLGTGLRGISFFLGDDPQYFPGKKSASFVLHDDRAGGLGTAIGRMTARWTVTNFSLVGSAPYDVLGIEEFSRRPDVQPAHSVYLPVLCYIGLGDFYLSKVLTVDGLATTVVKTNGGESFLVNRGSLAGKVDFAGPKLTILSPAANARFIPFNKTITITGRAADESGVYAVFIDWNNAVSSNIYPETFTTNLLWQTTQTLVPGTNSIIVYSVDGWGNYFFEAIRSFFYAFPAELILQTNGPGGITGQKNRAWLEIGRGYTVTAVPAKGQVFLKWTDGDGNDFGDTTSLQLHFLMQSGLILRANFGPDPFAPVAGTYHGLFSGPIVEPWSAGYITLTCSDHGTYSGKISSHGQTSPWSGRFAFDAAHNLAYSRAIVKPVLQGKAHLVVDLTIDMNTGNLSGVVDEVLAFDQSILMSATIHANHVPPITNAPAGSFNFALPGNLRSSFAEPGGYSYGILKISTNGTVSANLHLADGSSAVNFSTHLTADGSFPIYASTRKGGGVFQGWWRFAETNTSILQSADMHWVVSPDFTQTIRFYPDGFKKDPFSLSAYRYVPAEPGTNLVSWTDGMISFGGGNLNPENFGATFQNRHFTFTAGSNLSFSLAARSGRFTGSHPRPFGGIIIPARGDFPGAGYGFFKGTNETGSTFIGPN